MKQRVMKFSMLAVLAVSFACASAAVLGQNNNTNTAGGQMKQSGKETKEAGKSMGRHVKHGRIVKGGKHFGKHMGRAGKHFGKGTKKAVKKAVS
ncbi:MAG: hypothetical protein JWM21_3908 [Acidobacteria bacterium]|nr:hypothetical protein [Acidobacteriota bacterium]